MKRIIYKPSVGELIPNDGITYTLALSGYVVDVLVADNFVTTGTVVYNSLNNINLLEPFIHHFAGWEA